MTCWSVVVVVCDDFKEKETQTFLLVIAVAVMRFKQVHTDTLRSGFYVFRFQDYCEKNRVKAEAKIQSTSPAMVNKQSEHIWLTCVKNFSLNIMTSISECYAECHCNLWRDNSFFPFRMCGCWRSLLSCQSDSAAQQVSRTCSSKMMRISGLALLGTSVNCRILTLFWPPGRQYGSWFTEVAPPQVKAEHRLMLPLDIDRHPFSRYAKSVLKVGQLTHLFLCLLSPWPCDDSVG